MSRDRESLQDILDAARLAVSYASAKTKDQFLSDTQCQDAVVRRLEIIGEAARRISQQTQTKLPQLPWQDMIGMRNVMIHAYDAVDFEIVWDTVQRGLPRLIAELEKILPILS